MVSKALLPVNGIDDLMIGIVPFVLALFIMIALIIIFPSITLWLPQLMRG